MRDWTDDDVVRSLAVFNPAPMGRTMRDWTRSEHPPRDFYELLGKKRFDPDMEALSQAVKQACRELLPYQNHRDAAVAQRAMRLQWELGRAADVLADPEKLKKHHWRLLRSLRDQYLQANGVDQQAWQADRLQTWLEKEQDVHLQRSPVLALALSMDHAKVTGQESTQTTAKVSSLDDQTLAETYALMEEPAVVSPDSEVDTDEVPWVVASDIGQEPHAAPHSKLTRMQAQLRIRGWFAVAAAVVLGVGISVAWYRARIGEAPTFLPPLQHDERGNPIGDWLERPKDPDAHVHAPYTNEAAATFGRKLKDPDAHVRAQSAQALGLMGEGAKDALPALIEALKDKYFFVRSEAAVALGRVGPGARSAVPALLEALSDKSEDVRKFASDALMKIAPELVAEYGLTQGAVGENKSQDQSTARQKGTTFGAKLTSIRGWIIPHSTGRWHHRIGNMPPPLAIAHDGFPMSDELLGMTHAVDGQMVDNPTGNPYNQYQLFAIPATGSISVE